MIETCARKGYDAVEYDNLDSWTRFDGTAREGDVPFGKAEAIAFAELLADRAHALGLAVGRRTRSSSRARRRAAGSASTSRSPRSAAATGSAGATAASMATG